MKNLGNLSPAAGSNKNTKRLGRGSASGQGKTAGKGHKGQRARKGGGIRPGFEGGQTPLYRRLPKFGFSNAANKKQYHLVSLADLNQFDNGTLVDGAALREAGILKKLKFPVKVLANGKIEKKITVKLDKISKGARQAIADVGGTIQEI